MSKFSRKRIEPQTKLDGELAAQVEESSPGSDEPSTAQTGTSAGAPGKHKSTEAGTEAALAHKQATKTK
jgi:hypothetical protein